MDKIEIFTYCKKCNNKHRAKLEKEENGEGSFICENCGETVGSLKRTDTVTTVWL